MSHVSMQFVPGQSASGLRTLALCCALLLVVCGRPREVRADELTYSISGVEEELLANVQSYVKEFGITGNDRITVGLFEETVDDAKERAREALEPFGYYHPVITTNLVPDGEDRWRLNMHINPGPPVRVQTATIEIRGPGAKLGELQQWEAEWPLPPGAVLDQSVWQEEKQEAIETANSQGYLTAEFVEHSIRLDLINNQANLKLVLETRQQAHFGQVVFNQNEVDPEVLEDVPRFEPGSVYRPDLVSKFRLDLWQTGYFTDIEVVEKKKLNQSPPIVDIVVNLKTETRNIYQGTLGFGTDTGIRAQVFWSRSPLSSNGDRLDLGMGYQQIDDEFSLRADYTIPRNTDDRQFWVSSLTLQRDKQDLEVKRNADDENFITLAPGNVADLFFRVGKLQIRDRKEGKDQYLETLFVQYLRESYNYEPGPDADTDVLDLLGDPQFGTLFRDTVRTLAIGVEWNWPSVRGSGFATEGHHEQAWIFTSNEAWGSDRDFTQAYISSRRNYLYGDIWKLLLRAEVGYTDADVDNLVLDIDGQPFALSVSELPDHYRFKAGGSDSVRGYAFEELSNNDIGSNNIVTASVEVEMRVSANWSVAAFVDIGNAFNNWDEFELRKGAGVGVRWYSIAGPIRLDFAQALDVEGNPWRIHFTIGTPLL